VYSRRTALIKIATAATSAAIAPLLGDTPEAEHHLHEMLEQAPAPLATGPEYFSQADYATISKLADLIIPRTDTPGAVDARVPHWIDRQVAADSKLQERFKPWLANLGEQARAAGGADFVALTESQQTAILQAMDTDAANLQGGFFQTMKDLTVENYYRSEVGLAQELGFKGRTFRASFPGCTHPEHWPTHDATQERSQ
jgi:hypothetical protein